MFRNIETPVVGGGKCYVAAVFELWIIRQTWDNEFLSYYHEANEDRKVTDYLETMLHGAAR